MAYKAFKFKLNPTDEQLVLLKQHGGACRFIYNYFLNLCIKTYESEHRYMNYNDQSALFTKLRHYEEYSWLESLSYDAVRESLRHLDLAFKRFFTQRLQGVGFPNFKKKAEFSDKFTYSKKIKVEGNNVWLPKIGWVSFFKTQDIEGSIKQATITQRPSGWYVSFACKLDDLQGCEPLPTEANSIGIDLGIKSLIVDSNGKEYPSLKAYQRKERKLKREQRKLSRKKKGSNNRYKQQLKVASIHENIVNMRDDYAHKITTELIRENQAVFAEDLNLNGMMKNHHLAKSIADASMGRILRMLEYKAKQNFRIFKKIDRWYPSSKTCSNCGHRLDELKLSERHWVCPDCGTCHDRDHNAAINIKREGIKVAVGHMET